MYKYSKPVVIIYMCMCQCTGREHTREVGGGGHGQGAEATVAGAGPRLSCQFQSLPLQVWIQACCSLSLMSPIPKTHRAATSNSLWAEFDSIFWRLFRPSLGQWSARVLKRWLCMEQRVGGWAFISFFYLIPPISSWSVVTNVPKSSNVCRQYIHLWKGGLHGNHHHPPQNYATTMKRKDQIFTSALSCKNCHNSLRRGIFLLVLFFKS